jgi:hypothetical protein
MAEGYSNRTQLSVWILKETKREFDEITPQSLNKWEIVDFLVKRWNCDSKLREEFKKIKNERHI